MWPHKKGLGVQLTYGIKGNGMLQIPDGENTLVDHPVLNEDPLAKLSSTVSLVPKQTDDLMFKYKYHQVSSTPYAKADAKRVASEFHLPILASLLHTYKVPSEVVNSAEAYDPTFDNCIDFFYVSSNLNTNLKPTIAAYCTGTIGHILSVSLIEPTVTNGEMKYDTPRFLKTVNLTLDEPIKQIEGHKIARTSKDSDGHTLIRTSNWIYVINIGYNMDLPQPINILLVDKVNAQQFENHPFAHMLWSFHSKKKFVITDVKGNVFIMSLIRGTYIQSTKLLLKDESEQEERVFQNTLQLSNWRKILWPKLNEVMIATRNSLATIDLTNKTTRQIITAETWSRIRDISIPILLRKYMFILTSREIIWLDITGEEPQRLISWKHFLNDKDPSLKFTVTQSTSNNFICLVYSLSSPLVLSCSFGIKDEKPYLLSSPALIYLSLKTTPLQSLKLVELNEDFYRHKSGRKPSGQKSNNVFGLFETRLDLQLVFSNVTPGSTDNIFSPQDEVNFSTLLDSVETSSVRPFNGNFFNLMTKRKLLPLVKSITKSQTIELEEEEVEAVQQYAFMLGEGVDKEKETEAKLENGADIMPSYKSILELGNGPPASIKKVEELDMMIEQLKDYYESNHISVSKITDQLFTNSRLLRETPIHPTIAGFHRHIKSNYYNRPEIKPQTRINTLKNFSSLMVLGSTKATLDHLSKHYMNLVDTALNNASSSTKAIVNGWDESIEEETPLALDTQPTQFTYPVSSVPSIIIASQDTSTQTQKKRKKDMRKNVLSKKSTKESQSLKLSQPVSQSQLSQSPVNSQLTPTQIDTQADSPVLLSSSQPSQIFSSQVDTHLSRPKSQKQKKKKRKMGFA